MKLKQDKTRTLDYLINRVGTEHPELKIPKSCFFLGAGCSITSHIPLASKITELCQEYSFIDNSRDGHKIKKYEAPEDVKEFIKKRQSSFDSFINRKEKELEIKIETNKASLISSIPSHLTQGLKEEEIWTDFKIHFLNDARYGFWFEVFNENPSERQKLIESLIENKKPNGAYI